MTIFLEAIQRFVEPQEVSNPKLVLIVGCVGLSFNIAGLFLFHDHSGHSHGGGDHGHSHSHKYGDELGAAEEGHAHDSAEAVADETGNIADVLPESRIGNWPTSKSHTTNGKGVQDASKPSNTGSDRVTFKDQSSSPNSKRHQSHHSRSRSRGYSGLGEIPVHPASFRDGIIAASQREDVNSESGTDTDYDNDDVAVKDVNEPSERSPLLPGHGNGSHDHGRKTRRKSSGNGALHEGHKHVQPAETGKKGGHSHDDLNMRAVFLHVMGDALGNIGVIGSAAFIWKTDFSWRFYSDPLISLIITLIILWSAIPLCKAASRILLQAVPVGLSVDDIKQDILNLPDIVSCHHLHVWQLSDTQFIASLHVQVGFEFKDQGSQKYMELAKQIRRCLHEHGIHSSTIQPEFCCEASHGHDMIENATQKTTDGNTSCSGNDSCSDSGTGANGISETGRCMLECDDDCDDGEKCCVPASTEPGLVDTGTVVKKRGGKGKGKDNGAHT